MEQFLLADVPDLQRGVLTRRCNIQLVIGYSAAGNRMIVRLLQRKDMLTCFRAPQLNRILMPRNKIGLRPRHRQVIALALAADLADLVSSIYVPELQHRVEGAGDHLLRRKYELASSNEIGVGAEGVDLLVPLPHLMNIDPVVRARLHEQVRVEGVLHTAAGGRLEVDAADLHLLLEIPEFNLFVAASGGKDVAEGVEGHGCALLLMHNQLLVDPIRNIVIILRRLVVNQCEVAAIDVGAPVHNTAILAEA